MDLDHLEKNRIKLLCERYVSSINPHQVCSLASSHNANRPCHIFKEAKSGSYNVCFFIEFHSANLDTEDTQRWVARFPLPSVHDAVEKLKSEIATMKYIAKKTKIPIPALYGYGFGDGLKNPTGQPFLLMEYIDGERLCGADLPSLSDEVSKYFYEQLADILSQLRCQEFSRIGSLAMNDETEGWELTRYPLSMDLNDQQVFNLNPCVDMDRTLSSTVEYVFEYYQLLYNRFKKQRNSVYDEEDARSKVYALENFRGILFGFIQEKLNYGPFVLMHGDFRPSNILINRKTYEILGIIDWEWSRTVPLQFFSPPTWLTGYDAGVIVGGKYLIPYTLEYFKFHDAIPGSRIDMTKFDNKSLYHIWDNAMPTQSELHIASAVHRFSEFEKIYWDNLHREYRPTKSVTLIEDFFQSDGRKPLLELIEQKLVELESYQADLEASGIPVSPDLSATNVKEVDESSALKTLGYLAYLGKPWFSWSSWRNLRH